LWRLHGNEWRHRPEVWQQKSWLLHHDNSLSHTSFFTGKYWPKTTVIPHQPYSPTLTPLWFCSVSPVEDIAEGPPFWHSCGDWGRSEGTAKHHHKTRLPGWI
jgi:hypothetical protein